MKAECLNAYRLRIKGYTVANFGYDKKNEI